MESKLNTPISEIKKRDHTIITISIIAMVLALICQFGELTVGTETALVLKDTIQLSTSFKALFWAQIGLDSSCGMIFFIFLWILVGLAWKKNSPNTFSTLGYSGLILYSFTEIISCFQMILHSLTRFGGYMEWDFLLKFNFDFGEQVFVLYTYLPYILFAVELVSFILLAIGQKGTVRWLFVATIVALCVSALIFLGAMLLRYFSNSEYYSAILRMLAFLIGLVLDFTLLSSFFVMGWQNKPSISTTNTLSDSHEHA